MAENAPIAARSAAPPATAPVATVSAANGPAATGPAAPVPVATISVATSQGAAVPVATVFVATVPPAGAPAASVPSPATARKTAAPETAPPKPSEKKHDLWIWVVLALVVVGGIIGFEMIRNRKKPPGRVVPPVTISTTNAAKGDIDEAVEGLGTVTPVYTAMISPRVDGQLISVNYTEGQMVTTNDLLAQIDPGPYQASLLQAKGQLARDKAMLEGANVDLQRFQEAYGKGYGTNLHAIPKQQVDDQLALVHQDEGTVKYDEGQLSNAQVQLAYASISAPIAGRVGLRLVDPGNVIHAANTNAIVSITQLQPITVIFTVDQKHLPAIQRQLKAGHPMKVEAYNSDKTTNLATGTFLTMDNMIDIGTGTIRIKAIFANEDTNLFPNQFVNAKLIVDTLSNVTLIPTAAIQRNPQGAFVYLVTNKEVTLTNQGVAVTTNQTVVVMHPITAEVTDNEVYSVEGLEPGEVIATDNFNKLGDGLEVKLRQPRSEVRQAGTPGGGKKKGGKKDKPAEDPS
jgi:multidrug efflux system membrane fusion protein